jgi:citrate synthase
VPVPTAASTARPVPGGGPGTLTLVDSRTGKRYDVPIREGGVIRATDLKQIVAGGDGMGLRTYDPG